MSFLDTTTIRIEPEGLLTSKIAIVGEAGGADEERERRPWVGKAGRLLESLLGTAGISRSQCYLTNVIKEHPVNNNIKLFINFKKKVVDTTEAYHKYEAELFDELKSTDANVIVPCGNIPLYALMRFIPPKIIARRGSIYGIMIGDDLRVRKIIPTIHPSAALREYMFRLYIMKDFQRIKVESAFPEVNLPVRTLHVFPSYEQVMEYLNKILMFPLLTITEAGYNANSIAFDIEVSKRSKTMTHISISEKDDYAMSICFFKGSNNFFTEHEEFEIIKSLDQILSNPKIPKLAHNGSFDFGFLFREYGIIVRNMDDTMIGQGIVHPDMKKDLGFITSTRSFEPYYKDDGGKLHMGIGISEQIFAEYSAKDSVVLQDCWPSIEKDIERLGNSEVYEDTKRIIEPLVFMSQHGILVDEVGRNKERDKKLIEKEELTEKFCSIIGYEMNPGSDKQVMEHFYQKKGIKPYLKLKKPTCDHNALIRLALRGYKEADVLLEIRGLIAAIPKYWDAQLVDGRLKCFYNPIGGADTGRLSSSKTIFNEGMNQQNQPMEVRRYYIPDPGHILCEIDLIQAENRCVAYFAPEPRLIKAFEEGIDIHSQTAGSIFNKPLEEISRVKGSTDIGGGKYSERDIGKHSNHGFNYQLSAPGFSLRWIIALQQAQVIRTLYFELYPGIENRYWRFVQNELKSKRKLINPFGRTRLFLDRMGDELFKEGFAYLPQSTVASIVNKFGLIPFYYDKQFKDSTLLNQGHDSIGLQLPLLLGWDKIAQILLAMKRTIEQPVVWRGTEFTIPIEAKLGWNFMGKSEDNVNGLREVDLSKTQNGLSSELYSNFERRQ